jgi:sugar phosphate isomerase/epimerase
MKLGMQPDVNHGVKKAFEFASQHSFSHVEILMDHPYYSRENLDYAEILELKWSYDVDVLVHAPATSTNFLSISNAMRRMSYEELEKTAHFAERCEAEVVTFHIGWNPGFITARGFVFQKELFSEHNYKVLISEMYSFVKHYDSILALENTIEVDESLKRGIQFLLENTNLSLTFDIGHYNVKKGHGIFIENFERVVNVHLHDNDGKSDFHLPIGKGCVDLSILPLSSYDGFLTLEVRDEEAILKSKSFLERYMKSKKGEKVGRCKRA